MNREDGFYWVRIGFEWRIAKWSDNKWQAMSSNTVDNDFWDEIIEERLLSPKEKPLLPPEEQPQKKETVWSEWDSTMNNNLA